MTTKRLVLTNSRGQKLAARLELPVHDRAKSFALVAHCFTCSKDYRALRTIARAMTHVGIGVVRFDFTGLGQSEGEFAETTLSSNVQDLVAAASQIEEKLGPVQLLVGHSLGGSAVILAAEHLEKVRAVATINAPSEPVHVKNHFNKSLEEIREQGEAAVEIAGRSFKVRQEFIDDLKTPHMEEVLADLRRPLLVMHAPRDEIVSIDHASKIFLAARHPRNFISLDDADHLLSDPNQAEYVGQLISSWAKRYVATESIEEWRADNKTGQVAARTEKDMRTEIIASGFSLLIDERSKRGGADRGPNPYDLLAASLASCMSITLRMYADRKQWPLESVTIDADREPVDDGDKNKKRRYRFVCRLQLEGSLDDGQRQRLCEIAERCPVHRTITDSHEVVTELID